MTGEGSISDLFSALDGQEIAGGCDSCDAVQTVREEVPGVFLLTVAHDDNCPVLRASKARAN